MVMPKNPVSASCGRKDSGMSQRSRSYSLFDSRIAITVERAVTVVANVHGLSLAPLSHRKPAHVGHPRGRQGRCLVRVRDRARQRIRSVTNGLIALAGWGGRDRTCECRYKKTVPYRLDRKSVEKGQSVSVR